MEENPGAKVARVAKEFEIPRTRLRIDCTGPRAGLRAHNTKLSKEEEVAICRYINRLDTANFAIRPAFVTDAANCILKEGSAVNADHQELSVGKLWTTRFLKRHAYSRRKQRAFEATHRASKNFQRVEICFQQLGKAISNYGIQPEDLWNIG